MAGPTKGLPEKKGMGRRRFGATGKPVEVPRNGRRYEDGSKVNAAPKSAAKRR